MNAPELNYDGTAVHLGHALAPTLPDDELVLVSAAAGRSTRDAVGTRPVEECPTVRGQTVWETAGGVTAVVETPNLYGRREAAPPVPAVLVTTAGAVPPSWSPTAAVVLDGERWHRFVPAAPTAARHLDFAGHRRRFAARTAAAGRLARRLAQIGGVHLAFGVPESPVFVVLVPAPPERLSDTSAGSPVPVAMTPIEIPGVPGSVRIEVRHAPSADDIDIVAGRLEEALQTKAQEAPP